MGSFNGFNSPCKFEWPVTQLDIASQQQPPQPPLIRVVILGLFGIKLLSFDNSHNEIIIIVDCKSKSLTINWIFIVDMIGKNWFISIFLDFLWHDISNLRIKKLNFMKISKYYRKISIYSNYTLQNSCYSKFKKNQWIRGISRDHTTDTLAWNSSRLIYMRFKFFWWAGCIRKTLWKVSLVVLAIIISGTSQNFSNLLWGLAHASSRHVSSAMPLRRSTPSVVNLSHV